MNFFDRYLQLCEANNLLPRSEKAAKMFGVTRATITSWDKNQSIPKGDTLVRIADAFGVSVDYLLGRTDDPVDYSNPDLQAELAGAAVVAQGDAPPKLPAFQFTEDQKAAVVQALTSVSPTIRPAGAIAPGFNIATSIAAGAAAGAAAISRILKLCKRLDPMDQVRVEAYVEGMLTSDKYRAPQNEGAVETD